MIEANDDMQPKQSLAYERLLYPLSLLYALQTLPGRCIGSVDDRPLEDLSSLTVHLVNSSPLFDPKAWESIIHRLPKLKKLHLVFIMQSKPFNESFGHNYAMSFLQRCSYCEDKGKVITFSIHQMLYHMFYSSMDYSEPDVVIIYGNTDEMSSSDVEDIHTDMSYRNMSSSRDTVLILTDVNKDRLRQGVKAVNATRPMKQLVAPHMNPFF